MNDRDRITHAYDLAAEDYAAKFWDEIQKKNMDQILLKWFAGQTGPKGRILEIGGGPGEVSAFLTDHGAYCICTDRSSQMVEQGKKYFPDVQFEVQDFLQLTYADKSFDGVVAFYAIVNLQLKEIETVFREVKRVLKENGLFMFTFHIHEEGLDSQVKNEQFLDKPGAELTFYFLDVEEIKQLVEKTGFQIVDILVRYPYADAEYPSKRAYFVVRR
jgi:ubiquinone/menaquinone biosynthesis C-methylase UbiE